MTPSAALCAGGHEEAQRLCGDKASHLHLYGALPGPEGQLESLQDQVLLEEAVIEVGPVGGEGGVSSRELDSGDVLFVVEKGSEVGFSALRYIRIALCGGRRGKGRHGAVLILNPLFCSSKNGKAEFSDEDFEEDEE